MNFLASSEEIAVFHAHVETLLHHSIFQIHVGAWTNFLIRTVLMNVSRKALCFESFFLRVEYRQVVFHIFVTRLLECSRPSLKCCSYLVFGLGTLMYFLMSTMFILAWTGHIELKALPVEDLVVIESR